MDYDTNSDGITDEVGFDLNSDCVTDIWQIDTNEDGLVDQNAFDTDGDRVADTWQIDNNQNGLSDGIAVDSNRDGLIDLLGIDANEDGVAESYAFDTNADGLYDTSIADANEDGMADNSAASDGPMGDPLVNQPAATEPKFDMPALDDLERLVENPGVVSPHTGPAWAFESIVLDPSQPLGLATPSHDSMQTLLTHERSGRIAWYGSTVEVHQSGCNPGA